jgi:WD40 repeat protein
VQTFDAKSGAPSRKIRVHEGAIACLAFSEDGRRAVTAAADRTARIFDVATERVMPFVLTGHTEALSCAAFDAAGDRVVTASFDLTARIFDAATGEALVTLEGNRSGVLWAAFSRDGRLVATAGHDKTVRIFDAQTGDTLEVFRGHTGPVNWVAFAADGARLISHSWDWNANPHAEDGSVRIWNIRDERSLAEIRADVAARVPYTMKPEGVIVARPPGWWAK